MEKGSLDKKNKELYSDEELVTLAKSGDRQAVSELISRYICTVEQRAKSFANAVPDDLIQEGLMGLLKAVQTFDSSKNAGFYTYATVCVKNRMISAYKKYSVNFDEVSQDEAAEGHDPADIPENILLEKERLDELYDKIYSALSELEWRVFQMYLSGLAYDRIAAKLNTSKKTVDNAMQRVRRKLKSVLR